MATGFILLDTPPAVPQGGYPRRGGFKPSGTCIVHTSEGDWRGGVDALTNLLKTRADFGAYHAGCDWADIAWYYPWEWEAWQDTQTNNWAVGISAACKTSDWGNLPADIEEGYYRNLARMAADFVTYMKNAHGVNVPLIRISGEAARAKLPGFCAHGDSGIGRTDPGANFNWTRFFDYTKQALDQATRDEDDKMLVIGKVKDKPEIWIGDGVVRRHIPTPAVLQDYVWMANNGFLKIKDNGKVFEFTSLEVLGQAVELPFVNMYGTPVTVPSQLGWIDKNVNDYSKAILAALNDIQRKLGS